MTSERWFRDAVARRRLSAQAPTRDGLENLLAVADQALRDASVAGLSADARFTIAYAAVQAVCAAILQAAGYRARGMGHHETLFRAVERVLPERRDLLRYFNRCCEKRNRLLYEEPEQASEAEAAEIVERARGIRSYAKEWLRRNHPRLFQ